MPELPEVEVTRRSLAGLAGARILRLSMGKPLRWPLGHEPELLVGQQIEQVLRRGKYLLMPLRTPDQQAAGVLMWHLGMSGSLRLGDQLGPKGPHDHVELSTDRGLLRLTDPRRFGALVWSPSLQVPPASTLLARLGPEPFDPALTDAVFHRALARRRVAIKQALLSGEAVVGAGNIYASDALFEARIDPRTSSERVGPVRASRLLAAVRQVLGEAIDAGGSTLRDFHAADGGSGHYQSGLARVYGREGEPCARCGTHIRRIVQGQRATYFCPACQRR